MSRPGIFWTWQDQQVEDRLVVEKAVADIASHGFGKVLVQPRGCRYSVDEEPFIAAVKAACDCTREHGLELWLHLDPRSMARNIIEATGEGAEFLVVAGTGDEILGSELTDRPLDIECAIGAGGRFVIRLEYPKTRPYHVHSDGAVAFRPLRLERCLAYRRNDKGSVEHETVREITSHAQLFTNELSGYVEVFGRWKPPAGEQVDQNTSTTGQWHVLALVAFGSNYPDFAGHATRAYLRRVLDRYVENRAALAGLWWDEPGYCTGFDRNFRADRGRVPWGPALAEIHRQRTGREPLDDVLYLLADTDDGLSGSRRESYYRTIEGAVLGAQADLLEHGRRHVGDTLRMGVHQTWHQNADDVINGCIDWWKGARMLEAGYSDVGSAERTDDSRQMAEVTAMAALSVSLARQTESGEAYCNLWGVDYGTQEGEPGPEILDWWVDLQATLGCNWLAHTYGPTGYFERPSVWGPGYPDHPTWQQMKGATRRLALALELAQGSLPTADIALVYPLGALYRLGSDFANPLAGAAHMLIDSLLRRGYELDIVSPETLAGLPPNAYRGVVYLHPFGASIDEIEDLGRRREAGTIVVTSGLPPVSAPGYGDRQAWQRLVGLVLPEASLQDVLGSRPAAMGPELLADAGLEPAWSIPDGAFASRTLLPGGGTLFRVCPSAFARPYQGTLRTAVLEIELGKGNGLLCLQLDSRGEVTDSIAPGDLEWSLRVVGRTG